MPTYTVVGEDTNTASTTILYVVNGATTPRRLKLTELFIGSDDVPADSAFQYQIKRITDENATPGGTAVTPGKADQDDPAAQSNGVEACTAEPTYESVHLLELPLNQRATLRWVATPNGALVCSATEDYGFGLFSAQATNAVVANCTMMYEE